MAGLVVAALPPSRRLTNVFAPLRLAALFADALAATADKPAARSSTATPPSYIYEAIDKAYFDWIALQRAGTSVAFETQAHVPSYSAWLQEQDWKPAHEAHRRLLGLVGANDPGLPWELKNPSHPLALDALLAVHPDAVVVVIHRDPVTCLASMCSLAEASTRGPSTGFVGEVVARTQLDLLVREQEADFGLAAAEVCDVLEP